MSVEVRRDPTPQEKLSGPTWLTVARDRPVLAIVAPSPEQAEEIALEILQQIGKPIATAEEIYCFVVPELLLVDPPVTWRLCFVRTEKYN